MVYCIHILYSSSVKQKSHSQYYVLVLLPDKLVDATELGLGTLVIKYYSTCKANMCQVVTKRKFMRIKDGLFIPNTVKQQKQETLSWQSETGIGSNSDFIDI